MANYFQLPDGVRVSKNLPIDGDRYVVPDISTRDQLITDNRAFDGLQVYVKSEKVLYLLEDISVPTWVTLSNSNNIISQNISSGGTYEFVVGDKTESNAMFIHFMNYRLSGGTNKVFQMGELQLLHDGTKSQVTTNGQDIDLYVTYTSRLDGNNIILICDIPTNITTDVTMKYRIEKF